MSGYPYIRRQAVSLLVIAGLVAVTAGPAVAAPPSGVVPGVDIVPPGHDFPTAWRVNNRGQVLLFLSGLIWQRGLYTDIGGLGGGFTGAFGINDAGDVVGDSDLADGTRGVVWRRGRALELDALGRETSQGDDINDSGLAVGLTSPGPFEPTRATVWDTGRR